MDIHNNQHYVPLITPVAARTDDTAIVSAIIDTLGYRAVELVIVTGTNTDADATFTALLEESDASNMASQNAVADADLIGTELQASFTFADDGECRKLGYKGSKRYIRLTVTPSGNGAGNIFIAGVAILGEPRHAPTATIS